MKSLFHRPAYTVDRIITAAVCIAAVLTVTLLVLVGVRSRMYSPEVDTGVPFAAEDDNPSASGYLRQSQRYNFLLIGVDKAVGLADTVMVISLRETGNINVVQLPRDTYVRYGTKETKLNSVYLAGGAEALRSLIEQNLCIGIDYTVTVSTEAFAGLVDAVGGVEIDVPFDMDYEDPYQDLYIHIKAGKQTLNGSDAEGFVRYRSGYSGGDLDRIDAQKTFMKALLAKLRDQVGIRQASAIAEAVLPELDTDLEAEECLWFLKKVLADGLTGSEKLTMLTLPGKSLYSEELKQSFFVIGREAALEAVNTYLNIYEKDVSDEVFDQNRIFVRTDDDSFERIYTYSIINPSPVEGES